MFERPYSTVIHEMGGQKDLEVDTLLHREEPMNMRGVARSQERNPEKGVKNVGWEDR